MPALGQVVVTALLVVAAAAVFFLNSRVASAEWFYERPSKELKPRLLAISTLIPVFYVVVIAFWARRGRRLAAVAIALVTALFDTGLFGASLYLFHDMPARATWIEAVGSVAVLVGYVAAWGVARRRGGVWVAGLIATVVCGGVLRWIVEAKFVVIYGERFGWIYAWPYYLGAFVLSGLICWGLDAMSSGSRRATTAQTARPLGLPRV